MLVCDFVRLPGLRLSLLLSGLVGASLLNACTVGDIFAPRGPISDAEGSPWGDGDQPGGNSEEHAEALKFACDPKVVPENLPMRRLSRTEYANTLRLVVETISSSSVADQVLNSESLQAALSGVPVDSVSKFAPFARMDQGLSDAHIQGFFNVSVEVAAAMLGNTERRQQILGNCSDPDACIDSFIERFGKLVLRHPLSNEEKAFYREVYGATGAVNNEGLSDLISVFLNAPQFLYEVQAAHPAEGGAATVSLSNHEIASRLAFQFWRSAPDQSLLGAADRGELSDEESFKSIVERMLDDPRSDETLRDFAREWLDVDYLGNLDSLRNDPRYVAFAGANLPSNKLRDEMIDEVADSLVYHGVTAADTIEGWVLSPYSFARTPELAAIYGVPVWNGVDEPPRFPDGQRAGLVTRAALLSSASGNTRPIMKGVFIRERVLCDKLGTPDPSAVLVAPEPTLSGTTRQVVESLTQQPNTSCSGCHTTQLNALGFATENYDALGRVRTTQTVYDEQGKVLAQLPLDTTGTPRVWYDDSTASKGATDLANLIAKSGKVEACFARQVVRFSSGRAEDEARDGCSLETLRQTLAEGASVRDAMRALAMLPSFRTRAVEAE